MHPLMNNTKWDELRLAMYGLEDLCPQWRTKDVESGYISAWDGEWYYHFKNGGYKFIEWLEIKILSAEQDAAVIRELKAIHVPGCRTVHGFKVVGYTRQEDTIEYI